MRRLFISKIMAFVLALVTAAGIGAKAQDQGAFSFREHVEKHRQRVAAIALFLYSHEDSFRSQISQELLINFLKLHDRSKEQRDIAAYLSQHFGEKLLSTDEVVIELNFYDDALRWEFLQSRGLMFGARFTEAAKRLLRIEMIADLVDRGQDPTAQLEFGRPLLSASRFLRFDEDKKLAQLAEQFYSTIIAGLEYPPRCGEVFFGHAH